MAALIKNCCDLPKALRAVCESGCVYREKQLRHLACRVVSRNSPCVAPCTNHCICKPGPDTKLVIRELSRKEKNEMFLQ